MPKPVPVPRPALLHSATPALPPVYRTNVALPVQAKLAVGTQRPQPLAPPAFNPKARTAIIQRAENIPKSIAYSSIGLHYTTEQIALAAQQTGHDTGYTGHKSGGPGDGMNSGTVKANKDIVEQLQKNAAKAKKDKKKGPEKQELPKSARWRAINKAKLLMSEALKQNQISRAASLAKYENEYDTYLKKKSQPSTPAEDLLTEDDVYDCTDYWYRMASAEKVFDYDD